MMDQWNEDLASLAEDEEPEMVDMETVTDEAETSVDGQHEAEEVARLERSRFPLKEGDVQFLISKRQAVLTVDHMFIYDRQLYLLLEGHLSEAALVL